MDRNLSPVIRCSWFTRLQHVVTRHSHYRRAFGDRSLKGISDSILSFILFLTSWTRERGIPPNSNVFLSSCVMQECQLQNSWNPLLNAIHFFHVEVHISFLQHSDGLCCSMTVFLNSQSTDFFFFASSVVSVREILAVHSTIYLTNISLWDLSSSGIQAF